MAGFRSLKHRLLLLTRDRIRAWVIYNQRQLIAAQLDKSTTVLIVDLD